ncbi:MAG: phage tail sheath family protein [Steroidobacteraceae bacterium]
MPVSPTYPGIYIEEIQSSTHTITAAPTNIAVFIGYSHPFKTETLVFDPATRLVDLPAPLFGQAVQLFSFTDYERNFGGFFSNPLFSPDPTVSPNDYFGSLPLAVYQFFLNGGTECYVVGLQAKLNGAPLTPGSVDADGITFTAQEPTDPSNAMSVTITSRGTDVTSPPSPPGPDLADITITYGSGAGAVVETYRKVSLGQIAQTLNPVSNLVVVSPTTSTYPSFFTPGTYNISNTVPLTSPPQPGLSIAADFLAVFQQDSSLDKVPIFNLMVLPGVTSNNVLSEALAFCEIKRAFLIIDPPQPDGAQQDANWIGGYLGVGDAYGNIAPLAPNAAIYFPYMTASDPETGDPITLPPAATVAGVYATTDLNRGVWKAPAGLETTIIGITGVVPTGQMSDMRQGTLNEIAINCLRTFPGTGTVVFGARTSVAANVSQQQWKYVPVRRMALFLEQTLYSNLGWVVFEPNDTPLWTAIVASIEAFMLGLFRQGAFQGATPSDAFQVKCDSQTTTQADIDNGIVNIVVAFAPLKPAEFVVIQISQLAGQTQTS